MDQFLIPAERDAEANFSYLDMFSAENECIHNDSEKQAIQGGSFFAGDLAPQGRGRVIETSIPLPGNGVRIVKDEVK